MINSNLNRSIKAFDDKTKIYMVVYEERGIKDYRITLNPNPKSIEQKQGINVTSFEITADQANNFDPIQIATLHYTNTRWPNLSNEGYVEGFVITIAELLKTLGLSKEKAVQRLSEAYDLSSGKPMAVEDWFADVYMAWINLLTRCKAGPFRLADVVKHTATRLYSLADK